MEINYRPTVKMLFGSENFFGIPDIVHAIRNCHNSMDKSDSHFVLKDPLSQIPKSFELGPNDAKLIKQCIELGHTSVLEFVDFTFMIECSRVTQLQLVRHRMSSFSGESARVLTPKDYLVPSGGNPKVQSIYAEIYQLSEQYYNKLLEAGESKESARYVLPCGQMSRILYKANLRSLRNAISERTCRASQEEIRYIFNEIKEMFSSVPILMYMVEKCHKCPNVSKHCSGVF